MLLYTVYRNKFSIKKNRTKNEEKKRMLVIRFVFDYHFVSVFASCLLLYSSSIYSLPFSRAGASAHRWLTITMLIYEFFAISWNLFHLRAVRKFAYSSVSSSFIYFIVVAPWKQQHTHTSSTSDTNEAWAVHFFFFFRCSKAAAAALTTAIANSTHCHSWIIIANTQAASTAQHSSRTRRKREKTKQRSKPHTQKAQISFCDLISILLPKQNG